MSAQYPMAQVIVDALRSEAVADAPFDAIAEARRQWIAHDLPEPAAMAAATSVMRAQQIVSTAMDRALRPLGLTFARYEVLMLLRFARQGALPITRVGERLMVHPTGITKLVDKLEEQGLVRREANPNDRRGTLAHITPEGRATAETATRAVSQVRFGADLDDEDLEALVRLVRTWRQRVGELEPKGS
jgi:DNA-binding MarR family transcriptional regulator